MTFTVLLTHASSKFRERLAANLRRSVHPVEVEALGDSQYRFTVDEDRGNEIQRALLRDIAPWGAVVEITE